MKLRAADIAAATGGQLDGDDVEVDGASIDSRALEPGQLFVPIVAERDGHAFIAAAREAGAAAYLTSQEPIGGVAIVVDDTFDALRSLGTHARSRLPAPVVGITGSVGKTTVKDLLAAVLDRRFRTAASVRSFNNELGVPLTLVNAADGTEAVVVEMGARGIGHIAELCRVASPTVGVVTRVAAAHTELFGTLDDVARAKGELVEALPADGVAVLNAGDERVDAMRSRTRARVVRFGAAGDVVAEDVTLDDDLRASFRLCTPWGTADARLAIHGAHQVDNALAAAAAGLAVGVPLDDVAAGLAAAATSPWRMELVRLPSGLVVLNDSYNANPISMRAAVESLAAIEAGMRVALLGEMAELGTIGDDEHRQIGELARQLGIRVVGVGVDGYGGEVVNGIADAVELVQSLDGDVAVLVKGSRIAGLERVVELLRGVGSTS